MKIIKSLKVVLCTLLILCSMVVFSACKDDDNRLTFNDSLFVVNGADGVYTYDGESHIFTIAYEDKNINVTYSLTKDNFVKDLGLVDSGVYNVYYKVSLEGYKDYISNDPLTVTIDKRDAILNVDDVSISIDSSEEPMYTVTVSEGSVVEKDITDFETILSNINYTLMNGDEAISFEDTTIDVEYTIVGELPEINEGITKNYNINLYNGTLVRI